MEQDFSVRRRMCYLHGRKKTYHLGGPEIPARKNQVAFHVLRPKDFRRALGPFSAFNVATVGKEFVETP